MAGVMRQSSGHISSWEDIFVQALGFYWQTSLENCNTLSQWMQGFEYFANTVCSKWHLPCIPEHTHPAHEITLKIERPNIDSIPDLDMPETVKRWDVGGLRVLFVTDKTQVWLTINIGPHSFAWREICSRTTKLDGSPKLTPTITAYGSSLTTWQMLHWLAANPGQMKKLTSKISSPRVKAS